MESLVKTAFCAVALFLSMCAISTAQDKAAANQDFKFKAGIGVSLNPVGLVGSEDAILTLLPVGLANIHVPLQIARNWAIEPYLGIYSYSYDEGVSTSNETSSYDYWRIGVGVFYTLPLDNAVDAYFGPRAGFLFRKKKYDVSGSTLGYTKKENDFYIGLSAGVQYYLSSHFSIGGEAQVNYLNLGDIEYDPSDSSDKSDKTETIFTTNVLVMFRWYF
jgi:hypothetical protein